MADKRESTLGVLKAILVEMRATNRHMRVLAKQIACHNAAEIPDILRRIDRNTTKQNVGD
jgi:hypothetical protein